MEKSTLAILLTMMAFNACSTTSNDKVVNETRNVTQFSSITLNGISTVRIHQGPQAVRITIDADLIDRYETRVQGDTLMLGFKCGIGTWWALKSLKTCEVDITVPEFQGIVLNGAGKMVVDEFIYKKLELKVNGDGVIELRGAADELKASCTGDCKILASNLVSSNGNIAMTGSGRIEARVKDSLDASITGAGELIYWGNPEVSRKITGSGRIQRADD
jgi:hypothetical protein